MTVPGLEVYLHGKKVGRLLGLAPDVWRYAPEVAGLAEPSTAWSLHLLTSTSFAPGNVQPWFRALLPDRASCERLALQRGLTPGHDFALLATLGGDCPGALSLRLEGETTSAAVGGSSSALDELMTSGGSSAPAVLVQALWPDDGGLLPVCRTPNGLALPGPDRPSNALLRSGRPGLADAVRNEGFCMALASALDVPVLASSLLSQGGHCLLSDRPDSSLTSPEARMHLESFGQLLGLANEQGFEREGGLALRAGVGLIRRYSSVPALDLRSLLRWVVYCYLVGNGFACGRDLRFVFTPTGPRLARFVGILSTHLYAEASDRLGFHIGGEDRPDWLLPARWRELAEELGVGQRYVLALLRQMSQALVPAMTAMADEWRASGRWSPVLDQLVALAGRRARQLWVALEAERA